MHSPEVALKRLQVRGDLDAAELDAIDEAARAAVAAAEAEARSGPEPTGETLETQVWSDGGSAWRN